MNEFLKHAAARSAVLRRIGLGAGVLAMIGLSACSGGTSTGITNAEPATKAVSVNTMLQQVRAAGQIGNELDVQPLRDPQVEDLRSAASAAEDRGDYAHAGELVGQALALSVGDPDLLQWQAELALVARDWAKAEQLALQSYTNGPKLGGLCRRNWSTIRFAAEGRGNAAAAAQAQQRVTTCTVAPPTRM